MPQKFRIWDRQARRYVDNSCSLHCCSSWQIDAFTGEIRDFVSCQVGDDWVWSPMENPNWYLDGTAMVNEKRYESERWTGEVDQNGQEIYEGDIVEYWFGKSPELSESPIFREKIGWEGGGWRMISFDDSSSNGLCAGIVTVIGNMKENLDLITK